MTPDVGARCPVVTLTTDFGLSDHYVGVMKGVIAQTAPAAKVVDITHSLPAFDILEGAFAISQSYGWFPRGTVHVIVVDPGVGSGRRAIAARARGNLFVAPDNGVLSHVLESAGRFEIREIDARHGLSPMSRTFHGRDLFAPAAARLAAGLPFRDVGPVVAQPVLLRLMEPSGGRGRVLHVDRFGNIVTNFRAEHLADRDGLQIGSERISARADSYRQAPAGQLFLIEGSSGYLEVSVDRASAARTLGVRAGSAVRISTARRGPPSES